MNQANREYANLMVEVGSLLLEYRAPDLQTSPIKIRNFVYQLQHLYLSNPYHNSIHGAMVAHSLGCLLSIFGIKDT